MSGSFIVGTGDIFTKCNLLVFACGYLRYHYLQCLRPVTNENFQQQMLYIIERWPLDYMVRLRSATDPIIDAKTNLKIYLDFRVNKLNKLQGLSERMSKVKCLSKSQFSQKFSFLNCFRSEISGKFMPYSIQVHQNYPEASLEAGASDVLSGCDRLFEADH